MLLTLTVIGNGRQSFPCRDRGAETGSSNIYKEGTLGFVPFEGSRRLPAQHAVAKPPFWAVSRPC